MLQQQQQPDKSYCLLLVRFIFCHRHRDGSLFLISLSGIQAEGAATTSNIVATIIKGPTSGMTCHFCSQLIGQDYYMAQSNYKGAEK